MSVIRVFSFRAARRGFDETLRTVFVPDLLGKAGIVACYVGRQGPDDEGPRIVVTVWASRDAMVDAVGEELGVFHPEHLAATTDQALDILELRVDWHPAGEQPRILRVLRGDVRTGELEAYIADVQHGVELDARGAHGPAALFLGEERPNAFVTVSAWREWTHIERATGGNVAQPMATRHPERLQQWHVEHYELV